MKSINIKSYKSEYAVALCCTILMLSLGASIGWSSPSIPKLLAENSLIKITKDESSWIISLKVLGNIFGPILTMLLVDRFGRKITLLISAIPLIIGWILIITAKSVYILYIARFIQGISNSVAYCVAPMYLGEIASDAVRGSITTFITVMTKAGILLAYSVGPYVSFQNLAVILMFPPIIFIVSFIWLPESPYFLFTKNRDKEAQKSLIWLRNGSLLDENKIRLAVELSKESKGNLKSMLTKGNIKGLYIVLGLLTCGSLCGSQAIIGYAETIFKEVGGDLGASETSIILSVVQLVAAVISSAIVDKIGRRPLLLVSTIGVTICNIIVGLYFFLINQRQIDLSRFSWIPVAAIMIFVTSYSIGLATVPFAIISEVFPTNFKAFASSIAVIVVALISFIVIKMFQIVSDDFGIFYSFWIFGIFSFLFIIFIWILVPETKGKSLEDILEEMNGNTNRKFVEKL